MHHLLIDTNSLRQDRRRTRREFAALKQLMAQGIVQLHISEVVAREMITEVQADYQEKIAAVAGKIRKAPTYALSKQQTERIQDLAIELEQIANTATDQWEAEFRTWARSGGAKFHAIHPDHGIAVMDAYFLGAAPFGAIKNRKDIPDAYIFQAVLNIASAHNNLHVVSSDNRFRTACSNLEGVMGYDTLDTFLQESGLLEQLKREAEDREFIAVLIKHLRTGVSEELEERLWGIVYDGVQSHAPSYLEIDNHDVDLEEISEVDYIDFEYDGIKEYAAGLLQLRFRGGFQGLVSYSELYDTHYGPPDEYGEPTARRTGRDWFTTGHKHGGLVEMGATVDLVAAGYLTLRVPHREYISNEVESALPYLDIEFDRLTEFRDY